MFTPLPDVRWDASDAVREFAVPQVGFAELDHLEPSTQLAEQVPAFGPGELVSRVPARQLLSPI
jgi:hypothetical protein